MFTDKSTRPSEQKIQTRKIDEQLDLPVLENRGKINIYNDVSCRATASDVPEIIISTKQLLRNFVRIPARKMS